MLEEKWDCPKLAFRRVDCPDFFDLQKTPVNKREISKEGLIMPLYEYKCRKCGFVQEQLLCCSDERLELSCPKCKSSDLEKLISRANISGGRETACSAGDAPCCSGNSCDMADSCERGGCGS